jgi:hypothetical protein
VCQKIADALRGRFVVFAARSKSALFPFALEIDPG